MTAIVSDSDSYVGRAIAKSIRRHTKGAWHVIDVRSANEALASAEANATRLQIAVVDDLGVAKKIKALSEKTYVLLVTDSDEPPRDLDGIPAYHMNNHASRLLLDIANYIRSKEGA
jgi:hypothetical protein